MSSPRYLCPWCDERNEFATAIKDPKAEPQPGDVLICASCSGVAVINTLGRPRKPTESEWPAINDDPLIHKARKDIFFASHRGRNYETRAF